MNYQNIYLPDATLIVDAEALHPESPEVACVQSFIDSVRTFYSLNYTMEAGVFPQPDAEMMDLLIAFHDEIDQYLGYANYYQEEPEYGSYCVHLYGPKRLDVLVHEIIHCCQMLFGCVDSKVGNKDSDLPYEEQPDEIEAVNLTGPCLEFMATQRSYTLQAMKEFGWE